MRYVLRRLLRSGWSLSGGYAQSLDDPNVARRDISGAPLFSRDRRPAKYPHATANARPSQLRKPPRRAERNGLAKLASLASVEVAVVIGVIILLGVVRFLLAPWLGRRGDSPPELGDPYGSIYPRERRNLRRERHESRPGERAGELREDRQVSVKPDPLKPTNPQR